ncbi:MAG: HD domain-containing protein [Synergistaceae bacterium]|nr:HD domain-containing protein [Synergistaceae bacterium]
MAKDDKFKVLAVVMRSSMKRDKNGRYYWDLGVMDSDGIIDGKAWSNAQWWDRRAEPEQIKEPAEYDAFKDLVGKTVGLVGQVSEFRGQQQYNFNAVSLMNQATFPPHRHVQRSPVPEETLEREFLGLVDECDGPVREFLRFAFFKKNLWEEFSVCPAAVSHHHAYVGGLLEHTVAVARTAKGIAEAGILGGYKADLSVTIAGALLHDLGKLDAYRLTPVPVMTVAGTFHDHIAIGYGKFESLAREFGLEERLFMALGHIIVSHHGCREYGSPVLPATPEAMAVSAADEIDFRLFCWKNAVEQMEEGREISDYNHSAQRRFWRQESPNGA